MFNSFLLVHQLGYSSLNMGKSWEHHGNIMEEWWENMGKSCILPIVSMYMVYMLTLGKYGKIMGSSWKNLGKFHHDRTLFSRTLEIMISKEHHPQMAQQFRLVKYYKLPRRMMGKSWENHGKMMGTWWEHDGNMMTKWWENDDKVMGKWWWIHFIVIHNLPPILFPIAMGIPRTDNGMIPTFAWI